MNGSSVTIDRELSALAVLAAQRDERAWTEMVRRLDGVLRAVLRPYRLTPAGVDDVVQDTWLRALRKLHHLEEPGAVAGWLVVTARREALRTLSRTVREVVCEAPRPEREADPQDAEATVMERERAEVLHRAIAGLPDRQRLLLESLLASPPPSYEELSARHGMPIGSIGPTRDRAFARLRTDPRLQELICA